MRFSPSVRPSAYVTQPSFLLYMSQHPVFSNVCHTAQNSPMYVTPASFLRCMSHGYESYSYMSCGFKGRSYEDRSYQGRCYKGLSCKDRGYKGRGYKDRGYEGGGYKG